MTTSFHSLNYPSYTFGHMNKHRISQYSVRTNPALAIPPSSVLLQSDESGNLLDSKKILGSNTSQNSVCNSLLNQDNVVGIIGGVSIDSTLNFLKKLVRWSTKEGDDCPPFVLCSDPMLRKKEFLNRDGAPMENLRRKRVFLEKSGARCMVMPCHVSHMWYDEVSRGCSVPFLHMGECVARELKEANLRPVERGSPLRIGVLATVATLKAGFYQEKLQNEGFEVVVPDKATMEHTVIPATEAFKRKDMEGARNLLRIALQVLLLRAVNTVILASDDMRELLPHDDPLLKKCVDPLDALARSTIKWTLSAGKGTTNTPGYGQNSSCGEEDSQENIEKIPDDKASTPSPEAQRTIQNITMKPRAQSQYEFRKRPLQSNMEETSRSQPIRKKPRKLQPETQQETQEQTQGEQNSNTCSLLSIIRIVKDNELNDRHIASLKRTPFWLLFEAIINKKLQSDQCRKFDEVVLKIVQSYQEDTKAFSIGGKNIRLTKNHVRLVFGISCGNKKMIETKIKKESTGLAKRLDIKESRLSTTTIEKKIRELKNSKKQQDIDDVVRLLCLYLCVMLLFSSKATSVNWLYVHYIEDFEKIKEYDWAAAVSKYLLNSIHRNHRDIKQLKGCSILLLYFLCEHTKLVEVKTPDAVPRLLKWKISDLRKSLNDFEQLSQIPRDKVNNTRLRQTNKETKMFAKLSAQVFSVEEDVCTKIEQQEVVGDQDDVRGEENGEKGEERNEVGDDVYI